MTNPVEAPLAFDGHGRERLIPLDLSPYYPGDGPEFFQRVIQDHWDVSPDGRHMFVAVYGKLIRFDLPGGGPLLELIDPSNSSNVRVSPTGHMLAFQRPQFGSETYILNINGTAPRRVLPPASAAGMLYKRPTWAGPTRLLVVQQQAALPNPELRIFEMRAPDWVPTELVGLRNAPRFGDSEGVFASSSGDRLFVKEEGEGDTIHFVEYDSAGNGRRVRVRFPRNAGFRLALSPDASQVVTATDSGLVVYDIESGLKVAGPFGVSDRIVIPVAWTAAEYP